MLNVPTAASGPFQYRDFRVLSLGTVLSSLGITAESLVVGWFVLNTTDSPFMVGLVLGLRMVPNALFGIPAGVVADIVNRPRFIAFLSAAMAIPTAALGLLIMAEAAELWHVIVLTFVLSTLQVFDSTARASFVYDIVGKTSAIQGLATMSLMGRIGRVVGALGVGFIIARQGQDAAFFVSSAFFALTAVTMIGVRSRGQAAPVARVSARRAIGEFAGELRTNRVLLTLVATTGAVEILGFSHKVLLPSLARDVLDVGAEGLGIMNGVGSLGGVLGIVFLSVGGETRRKGMAYLATILAFGVCLMLLGVTTSFLLVLLVLAMLNAMMALSDTLSQGLMQLAVPNEFRGRAMGSWMLALGAGPLGTLQMGALASLGGVTLALSVNGLGLVALALAITAMAPLVRRI